jgi:eukaryotic-like serine/threonine-protein kinase
VSNTLNREREIFGMALEYAEPEKRASYLNEACGEDVALRRGIESLLRVYDAQSSGSPKAEEENSNSPLTVAIHEGPGTRIDRYKLLERIGEGGHGTVYVAEQETPVRRRVALKVIKLGMDTREVIARFEAERQALALMDHSNIARVLDAGATERGRPYFVMELVRGVPITRHCDEHKLDTADRLRLFIQVCTAVQHAHQKGIIHRDLKPSNILVTLHDGVPVPKVIDFGIAKAMHGRLTERTIYTRFEQFVGTPAYMSPEQLEMSGLDVDTRSDIYSLGVLLYELLTGRPPFESKELLQVGIDEMRRTIREKEPPRPSTRVSTLDATVGARVAQQRGTDPAKLRSWLRGDIDWIVMRSLEKDRTRRYETASSLASDLQRYLRDEPVSARPPTSAYRLQKAWKRNKVTYTAGAAVVVALVIGIGLSMRQTSRALRAEREQTRLREVAVIALDGEKEQRTQAEAERQRAQDQESEARHRAYASDMNLAKQALDDNNLGRALDMLNQQRPNPGQTDLRGWEWRYLWGQTRSDALFTLCQESSAIHSLALSPDGNLVAAAVDGLGGLSLWSVPDRREVFRLAQTEQNVCVAFSPTDPLLAFTSITTEASGKLRSSLRVWNISTRKMVMERPLDGECANLTISKDGQTLVTITAGERAAYKYGGHITLWRLPEGTQRASYPCSEYSFAVTPDLSLAASAGPAIRVVDLRDGRELWNKNAFVSTLALSPDGKLLAAGGGYAGEDILLLDAATGQEVSRLTGHRSWVTSLVFWPDGKKLASGSADQTIRLWDIPDRKCVETLRGHRQQVWKLALMPDHQTLVSGCRDGTVSLWNTSVSRPRRPRIHVQDSVLAWAFEADGKSVLTLNGQGRVTRWKGANFELEEPLLETGKISDYGGFMWCFSRDGRRLALGSPEGLVQVWDIPSRALWRQITSSTGRVRALRFLANGNRLLTLSVNDFVVHEWDLTTPWEIQSWRAPADIIHYAISPDERSCVILGYRGDVELRNLGGEGSTTLNLDIRESHDGNFSPDGRMLAVPSSLGFVRIWDATTWREMKTLGGFFDTVYGAVYFSDGRRLAVASGWREAIKLYDTATWQNTLTLEGEGGVLWPTMISPDDNAIGSIALGSGRLQLWRAPSWAEIGAAEAKEKAETKQP